MDAFVRYRCQRRRLFPYFVGVGLVIGLGHEKRTWKKERSTDWFDHIVLETFDDNQWIENFRMKIETFASLCRDLETSLAPLVCLFSRIHNDRQFIWSMKVDGLQYNS